MTYETLDAFFHITLYCQSLLSILYLFAWITPTHPLDLDPVTFSRKGFRFSSYLDQTTLLYALIKLYSISVLAFVLVSIL